MAETRAVTPITSVLKALDIGGKAKFPIEKLNSVSVLINRMNIVYKNRKYKSERNIPGRYIEVTRLQ